MIVGYINGQELSLSTQPVASDTINYLEMQLNFRQTADWAGLDVWVHFAQKETVYDIHAPGGRILREQGLNLSAGEWSVYVHGNAIVDGEPVLRITAGPAVLRVRPVGMLRGEPFPTVPPSAGEQIIAEAVTAAGNAAKSAADAAGSAGAADAARRLAENAAASAGNSAAAAAVSEENAQNSAKAAAKSETNAAVSADRAEQVAVANGYAVFEMGEDGCLYYGRTDNIVDLVDFVLNDAGELEVIVYA